LKNQRASPRSGRTNEDISQLAGTMSAS